MLRLADVEAGYGDVVAVRSVSLEVRVGEIVALIGSNGAGKTTTLRAIAGLLPLRRGRVELDGRSLTGLGPAAVVAAGVAHVPEGRQLFPTMTVRENLELGARTREGRARRPETLARVFELFPRLAERLTQLAGTLSGGEQQMVAIGRALMARPRLLMLDEPSRRPDHPARRAERAARAQVLAPRLRAGERDYHPDRRQRRAAGRRADQARVSGPLSATRGARPLPR